VHCFMDSELVVKQLNKVYRIRSPRMSKLFDVVKKKEERFEEVTYSYIPREESKLNRADELVNQIIDAHIK